MIWILIGVVAALIAVPFVIRVRLKSPDPSLAKGEFVQLSQGVTHYRWIGPVRGPVIVAIHGLTTPSDVWDAVAHGLGRIGYRVLAYDLYGRGYSSPALGRQDRPFHLRQLEDLLADQGLNEDLTIMGYSMGGSIATAFAADHPHRMKRLILVAPAGIAMEESSFERMTRRLPVIGDWLNAVFGATRMTARILPECGKPTEVPEIVGVQLAQLRQPGFLSAVLSSRRGLLNDHQEEEHRKISRDDIPVIAIWGDQDKVIPMRAVGVLSSWNRQTVQEVIPGAGHGLPYTHGTAIAEILRNVLREKYGALQRTNPQTLPKLR
ncbi:MAG: alpha/beta hydrolase [Rhodobacterales bacterium]|nr:alpha/beta hydrolase [Rhodobacterales bacterium]